MNKLGWLVAILFLAAFICFSKYSLSAAEKKVVARQVSYTPQAIQRVNDLAIGKKHKWTKEDTHAALIELGWGHP